MTPTAADAADRPYPEAWAVHAWNGEEWRIYHPEGGTKAAAEAVADRVKGEHPTWGVKLVDETP